jgi:murein peptide amidase A
MKTTTIAPAIDTGLSTTERRSLSELLAPLDQLAAKSSNLLARPIGQFERDGHSYELPRYIFVGPQGGDVPIPVGIFAGIYGDEPEGTRALVKFAQLLEAHPELATGYCLFLYPACNPTGLEAGTAFSSRGKDLNLELVKISHEPEARLLQGELASQRFEGMIKLHTKAGSSTFYGLVRGETLARQLLDPALAAAAELLPVAEASRIEAFRARDVSYDHYEGGSPMTPKSPTRPFEVILETPGQVPAYLREWAFVLALRSILTEYRKFLAYAPNL